jgi:hypothetical protein
MIRTSFGFLALLALLPALQARDKPDTPTPAQQYQALLGEYNKAMEEFEKEYREAKTPQDKQKVFREKYPQPGKFIPRFLELAEKNSKDPAAVDALVWILSNSNSRSAKSDADNPRTKAIKILLRDHVQSEKMVEVCLALSRAQDEDSQRLLRVVLEKNPNRTVKAQACIALAQQAENQLRMARRFKTDPQLAKRYEGIMGKEAVEKLFKADLDNLSKETASFYQRIVKDFADVSDTRGGTLGKLAERKLEALLHPILVGKPAPEIEGEDLDGSKFKLSDYRGKVVMLDFWGHW